MHFAEVATAAQPGGASTLMSQPNFKIDEQAYQEFLAVASKIAEAKTDDFFELAKLTGRDPKTDFVGADLRGINFNLKNINTLAPASVPTPVPTYKIARPLFPILILAPALIALIVVLDPRFVPLDVVVNVVDFDPDFDSDPLKSVYNHTYPASSVSVFSAIAIGIGTALSGSTIPLVIGSGSAIFIVLGSGIDIFRAVAIAIAIVITIASAIAAKNGILLARSLESYLDHVGETNNILAYDLSNANLSNANLSNTVLSNADLSSANLSNADLMGADLSNANLNGANVVNARFGSNLGLSDAQKKDLMQRGAIFEETPG